MSWIVRVVAVGHQSEIGLGSAAPVGIRPWTHLIHLEASVAIGRCEPRHLDSRAPHGSRHRCNGLMANGVGASRHAVHLGGSAR